MANPKNGTQSYTVRLDPKLMKVLKRRAELDRSTVPLLLDAYLRMGLAAKGKA